MPWSAYPYLSVDEKVPTWASEVEGKLLGGIPVKYYIVKICVLWALMSVNYGRSCRIATDPSASDGLNFAGCSHHANMETGEPGKWFEGAIQGAQGPCAELAPAAQ